MALVCRVLEGSPSHGTGLHMWHLLYIRCL